MNEHIETTNVAIVGGGLAGLAAACHLACACCSMTLFEKSHAAGGRAETDDKHGFSFNLGAHALYDGSPAMNVLKELNVMFSGGSPGDYKAVSGGSVVTFEYAGEQIGAVHIVVNTDKLKAIEGA